MRKEYVETIRTIFPTNDWRNAADSLTSNGVEKQSQDHAELLSERQGAIGVAIMLAFFQGVKPHAADMSRHLNLDQDEVEIPFRRLLINGYFSPNHDLKNDKVLLGQGEDRLVNFGGVKIKFTSAERTQNAWCIIAGISAGLTGLRED